MTRRAFIVGLILLALAACARGGAGGHDVLGLRVGMSRDDALKRLEQLGRKERDERKQQEVWALNDNPDYTHLLVGFNKEKTEVRYVTAVARPGRVRYDSVVDLQKAKRTDAGANNHTYEQEVAADSTRPGYIVSARGTDAQHLLYYSLKRYDAANPRGEEEEEETEKKD